MGLLTVNNSRPVRDPDCPDRPDRPFTVKETQPREVYCY